MRKYPSLMLILVFSALLVLMLLLPDAVRLVEAQTATSTPTALPTPTIINPFGVTPVLYITPTPTGVKTTCYAPQPIKVGDYGYIRAGIIIRHLPTLSGAQVDYIDQNVDVVILEGPKCVDGLNWWRVSGTRNPGWVAEGDPDMGYFLFSYGSGVVGCNPVFKNAVGKPAELLYNTKVRENPDPNALVKTVAPAGTIITPLAGPQCVEGYLWWQVRVTVVDFTYEGWMAEGADEVYWLVPEDTPNTEDGTLCADPLSFVSGQRGLMRYRDGQPKYLRSAPGTDQPALFSLVNFVPFIILDGPVCRENLNWWKIRVLASTEVIGWVAEGSPGVGYWIRALEDTYPLGPGR